MRESCGARWPLFRRSCYPFPQPQTTTLAGRHLPVPGIPVNVMSFDAGMQQSCRLLAASPFHFHRRLLRDEMVRRQDGSDDVVRRRDDDSITRIVVNTRQRR